MSDEATLLRDTIDAHGAKLRSACEDLDRLAPIVLIEALKRVAANQACSEDAARFYAELKQCIVGKARHFAWPMWTVTSEYSGAIGEYNLAIVTAHRHTKVLKALHPGAVEGEV